MVDRAIIAAALGSTLGETSFHEIGEKYEGKVRDNYTRGDRRYIVVTDRISAFDRVLGTIPFKGQVLNRLATWWFERTKSVAPNHVIATPDPNVLECVECEPLLVEMVVRAYLTGTTSTSIWVHYAQGARTFCGHPLPEGMKKNQRLPTPLLTPATKAPKGEHDKSASREEILAEGKVSAADFDEAGRIAMALFAEGQRIAKERGLILADTKYELGKTKDGRIVVIDEIHTPDSSRYWLAESYGERFERGEDPEPLDKDYVRRWLLAQNYKGDGAPPPLTDDVRIEAARRYIDAYERITGEAFVPDVRPPHERIFKNLAHIA
jgi:phosphoribosylaminoimidazole-succinocarboxamide synthase